MACHHPWCGRLPVEGVQHRRHATINLCPTMEEESGGTEGTIKDCPCCPLPPLVSAATSLNRPNGRAGQDTQEGQRPPEAAPDFRSPWGNVFWWSPHTHTPALLARLLLFQQPRPGKPIQQCYETEWLAGTRSGAVVLILQDIWGEMRLYFLDRPTRVWRSGVKKVPIHTLMF